MRAMVHRWIRGDDLVALLWILRQMLEQSGSIEGFFLEGYRDDHEDIGPALDCLIQRLTQLRSDLQRGDSIDAIFAAAAKWRAELMKDNH